MLLFGNYGRRLRPLLMIASVALCCSIAVLPVNAQSNSSIAQGFQSTDSDIAAAALVGIKNGNTNSIELSSSDSADRLVGVVSDDPLIGLSDGGSNGIQVVTSGLTMTLVSDINGTIKNGDKIAASPIRGVGMKATTNTVVVGTAQGDLSVVQTQSRDITAKDGHKKSVKIGLIPVRVGVAYFSLVPETSPLVPGFLQQVANNVSGRNVSPVRVLVATLILLLVFASIIVLTYSAVRSSIISIGRNPLSESAVRNSLFELALTVMVVLIFSTVIVYLVLTV